MLTLSRRSRSARNETVPLVSTRDHFDVGWTGAYRREGIGRLEYETNGVVPGLDGGCANELTVLVHGFKSKANNVPGKVEQFEQTVRNAGYGGDIVGYSWDGNQWLFQWWDATQIAKWNGPKLAAFTRAYAEACPSGRIRYVAHSLGAQVVLSALQSLVAQGGETVVESVSLLGAAEGAATVALDGQYGSAIPESARQVDNFWMDDDAVLDLAYGAAEWEAALGSNGVEGTAPSNYADHRVGDVPDHFSYYEPGEGCMPDVVDSW
jgi:pimeloyl-ACP methyl ester carboxylesterase